ncbi:MAG: pseudouridine synthase [Candidatus Sulfotelmatobacter sp.]
MARNEPTRRVGLARAISKLGHCSRSQASELIRSGRVTLNGALLRDPEAPVSGQGSEIKIDGRLIEASPRIYLMMNKPRGLVTTASDEKSRETVYGILNSDSWLAPVGRLDKASEGLLLFTNDSEWAARIGNPETHLEKTYHVQLGILAQEQFMRSLVKGVKTVEGELLRAKKVRLLRSGEKNSWLEIILDEGRNRHIRRMMEAMKIEVLRLIRVAIGPLQLGDLAKGVSRKLTREEKKMLDHAMNRNR